MVLRLVYFRGNGGFNKKFSLSQDGSPFDIDLLTNPVITWQFKKTSSDKKSITWTSPATGSNNEIAGFNVPANFFDECKVWECSIEVKDDSGFLVHTEEMFEVEVKEPAGVTTDS